jgi:hypothetical protein
MRDWRLVLSRQKVEAVGMVANPLQIIKWRSVSTDTQTIEPISRRESGFLNSIWTRFRKALSLAGAESKQNRSGYQQVGVAFIAGNISVHAAPKNISDQTSKNSREG